MYYVYAHIKRTNNDIFYIGKGKGKRAWIIKGRSKYWNNIINKHEYYIKILKENLSETDALILEKQYISQLNNLCNLTKGGEGISGFKFSNESKLKKSKSALGNTYKLGKTSLGSGRNKGIISPFLGKHHTNESKEKIRKNNSNKNKTESHKCNISISNSIPIKCIETNIIFKNALEAEKIMGISKRMIREVCRGLRNKAKNYTFKNICQD